MLRRAWREQMFIFLEGRAAAGGVCNDGVEILAEENIEVDARLQTRRIAHSCVGRQRAAAGLSVRDHDFASIGRENTNGGFMQRGKADLRDAPGEQSDARAAMAGGG